MVFLKYCNFFSSFLFFFFLHGQSQPKFLWQLSTRYEFQLDKVEVQNEVSS